MADITIGKITIGGHTIFLRECPECGRQRDIGGGAVAKAILLGAGVISVGVVGYNIFTTLGIIKMLLAGTITASAATDSVKKLYEMKKQIAEWGYFKCPSCGCTKLFKD